MATRARPPATLRRFDGPWHRLRYLHDKLLYWSYGREDGQRARHFAEALERHLLDVPDVFESAIGCGCAALVAEAQRDWARAIRFRRREIQLFEKIRALAPSEKPIARRAILRDFSPSDLADRYDLLAIALWNAGSLDPALEALDQSERICRRHRAKFDGGALRRDLLREQRRARRPATPRPASRSR